MDKLIVLSGVNMVEGGILTVFRTMIASFSKFSNVKLICLVHDKQLFGELTSLSNVEFREFKGPKSSWLKRIKFEFFTSYALSKTLKPDAWICLHDISARVAIKNQFVYCHNPSPFYKSSAIDLKYDKTFFLFTKFYKFLYGINIKSNRYVIVQQEWIAKYFEKNYGIRDLLVARPVSNVSISSADIKNRAKTSEVYTLIYPAFPRTFKNFEIILDAMEFLREHRYNEYNKIKIVLTFKKGMTKFGDYIITECEKRQLDNIFFSGLLNKEDLNRMYSSDADALIFPSKLETWGLPLSEAKSFNLPIFSADLPYARETIGSYDQVAFFRPDDAKHLAEKMIAYCEGQSVFCNTIFNESSSYIVSNSWDALADHILTALEVEQ